MKKLLSYIIPMRIKNYYSKVSGPLEINMINGRKILDAASVNYSYGSLQRILRRGLSEIQFDDKVNKVLVLGLGGGSIVQTIRADFESDAFIELVDIDPEVISIAINEFEIHKYGKIKIHQADAFSFLKNCTSAFDIIVVDIFIGDTIPKEFTSASFIDELVSHLGVSGTTIFNTLTSTMQQDVFSSMLREFSDRGMQVKVIEGVESTNTLILAGKNEFKIKEKTSLFG